MELPRRKRYTTLLITGREGCRVMESNARREGGVPSAPGCLKTISRCLQHLSNRKQRTGGQRSTVMSSDPITAEHEELAPFREEAETITVYEVNIFFDSQANRRTIVLNNFTLIK
ncbi:hypothetical protein VPH35_020309 [Triticum aestivum]